MSWFDTANMLDFHDDLQQFHPHHHSNFNHNSKHDTNNSTTETDSHRHLSSHSHTLESPSNHELSYSRLLLSDILSYDINAAVEQDHQQAKAMFMHRCMSQEDEQERHSQSQSQSQQPTTKRNDFIVDYDGDEHDLDNLVDGVISPTISNANLVSEQSFLTASLNSTHDDLVKIFQEQMEKNEVRDAHFEPCYEDNSSNTASPESCLNGYMKFVINSSQVPPFDYNEVANNEDDMLSLPSATSPNQELTHEEVIRLFEETCKEIDEWKSTSDLSRVRLHPIRTINGQSSGFNTITNAKFISQDKELSPLDETLKASPNFKPVDNNAFEKSPSPPLFADDSFDEPDYTHNVSIPAFVKDVALKRSSSLSSLKSDQSHLSFHAQLNISSTSSSPLEKSNNSSGISTPGIRRNKYKLTSTGSQKSLQKTMFRTGSSVPKIDFSQMSIESIPDIEYSKSLASTSSKIPSVFHCSQLIDKLIAPLFGTETCSIQRTLYLRNDFDKIFAEQGPPEYNLSFNTNFKKTSYEAQFILTKVDDKHGKPDNTTRAGLCPYCESIEFFGLKNSSYGNHLAYKHGILTNGKPVPDPKFHGLYQFKKGEYDEPEKKKRKTNAHMLEREGVLCTDCWQILEVNCTSRSSILGHYLRHYRDSHVGYKKENKSDGNEMVDEAVDDPVVFEFISQWES
ncbi:hypothetical protein KGF57_003532 [Candida theae]|uniref:Transcription regulator Rua1 C-terminal domain-containing protein n=1 Tax=Candida theae TaxID=1198502 RepID=A0AAD5FXV9_9ASCO|nr:uncharacterized protein KGF57_003532 [Candida theae]KAI5956046.1 hypothetical protein KGF57_003532 [Candida theae]